MDIRLLLQGSRWLGIQGRNEPQFSALGKKGGNRDSRGGNLNALGSSCRNFHWDTLCFWTSKSTSGSQPQVAASSTPRSISGSQPQAAASWGSALDMRSWKEPVSNCALNSSLSSNDKGCCSIWCPLLLMSGKGSFWEPPTETVLQIPLCRPFALFLVIVLWPML